MTVYLTDKGMWLHDDITVILFLVRRYFNFTITVRVFFKHKWNDFFQNESSWGLYIKIKWLQEKQPLTS